MIPFISNKKYRGKGLTRFWSKVKKTETCWLWQGSTARGYGHITLNKKTVLCHILIYKFAFGELEPGHWVLHRCDVRNCIRPAHLFSGTHQDNINDMWEKGRGLLGEKHGGSKLKNIQVIEIKNLIKQGKEQQKIARKFNVSEALISSIKHGNRWGWLI